MNAHGLLLVVHVIANLVWIGSILAVAVALSADVEARVRGQVARAIYRKLAAPAFGVSFVAAVALLTLKLQVYFVQTHWMHAKLALALVVIVLHHMIGAKTKALESGKLSEPGPVGLLGGVLFVCALGAAFLAILKPF
jgi:putative membrane protein